MYERLISNHDDRSYSNASRIQKLSPLLINQLSAGEVVTRPASVVKELLENAIDAGANKIQISITQGGMGLIEIIDNGSGIHPDDMLMAVTRHATSKVADIEQLHGICTLGFRGEALASISAVSRLSLTSSHDDSGVGRCLSVAGQIDTPDITPVVCAQGTTVAVRDLYFNVPARRGNLKSISTEYAHIESVIRHIALVYANIELQLYHEGKCRLTLPANQNNTLQLTRIQQAIASPFPEIAYPIFVDLSILLSEKQLADSAVTISSIDGDSNLCSVNKTYIPQINGWLWIHNKPKSLELPKLIYINNRLVKDSTINLLIRQTLLSLDIANNQAGYALFFTLPNEWLNLNVHPSKQRISIHTLANINAHLKNGLHQLLLPIVEKSNRSKPALNSNSTENTNNARELFNHHQNQNIDYQYSTKESSAHIGKHSQVSSPKTLYQVDNVDNSNNSNNSNNLLPKTSQLNGSKQQYRLLIITEQQSSQQKAEQLAQIISEALHYPCSDSMSISTYRDSENNHHKDTYTIEILIDMDSVSRLNTDSTIEKMIAFSDTICSPWMVFYKHESHQIELIFQKNVSCQFRQRDFNVIHWASFEVVDCKPSNSDIN